jgi:hypothetical protein
VAGYAAARSFDYETKRTVPIDRWWIVPPLIALYLAAAAIEPIGQTGGPRNPRSTPFATILDLRVAAPVPRQGGIPTFFSLEIINLQKV